MKIKFRSPPAYVCENRVPHYDAHLTVFVGLELEVTRSPDGAMYMATTKDVLVALIQQSRDDQIMAVTYWTSHWHRIRLGLSAPVYFPKACCQVIDPPEDEPCLFAS